MLETYLRPSYQKWLVDPVANCCTPQLSAHHATYLACVLGMGVMPALIFQIPWLACFLLLISGYLDTLDGTLARMKERVSPKGTMLDLVSDRAVEFAVVLGLYGVDPTNRGWLAMGMLGSILICVTSFLVVGIFAPNQSEKSFHYSPGLIERAEAFIFFILMMLFPETFSSLAILFIVLVLMTAYIRIRQFLRLECQP